MAAESRIFIVLFIFIVIPVGMSSLIIAIELCRRDGVRGAILGELRSRDKDNDKDKEGLAARVHVMPQFELGVLGEDFFEGEVFFESGEVGVAFVRLEDIGEVEVGAAGEELLVEVGAADEEEIGFVEVGEIGELVDGAD